MARPSFFLQQNRVHQRNYLLLLVICLLAYWPLTFGVFSVKNDAIHYFLPYRFNISEALRNGEGPFWSPYIYLGYPVQGDMQSGAWNPFVWLFSMIGRYDLTLFHFENLLYIFLGGVGMYKLTNRLVSHTHTSLLIAVSYMLSGFMLGGQLINWLAAAAFFPFVIHYYLLTLRSNSLSDAVKTGIALFLLFTAGYPSFFIITAYIMIALAIIQIAGGIKNKEFNIRKFALAQSLALVVFAGLSLPAIISFIDLLPYYQRGAGTGYAEAVSNSWDPKHFLTFLFPSTIKANDMVSGTDLTCRNIYIGLLPLLLLFVFPPARSRRTILLGVLAILALLFSMGDATPFRKLCYQLVPLLDTFRHPSQARLFFIFAVLLLVAPSLKKLLTQETVNLKKFKWSLWIVGGLLFLITIFAFIRSSLLNNISGSGGITESLKNVLDSVSLADGVAVNGAVQLFFILMTLFWLKKRSSFVFSACWVLNIFMMAQFVLPSSFVSKTSPSVLNKFIHASPKGFPVTGLERSLAKNSTDAFNDFDRLGLNYFYNKKIGISRITNSPAFLTETDSFIQAKPLVQFVAAMPVAYTAYSGSEVKGVLNTFGRWKTTDGIDTIYQAPDCNQVFFNDRANWDSDSCDNINDATILELSSNSFSIRSHHWEKHWLVLTQNYHSDWRVYIDGERKTIEKVNLSFMATEVPAGKHIVVFRFVPIRTIRAIWVQLFVILAILFGWLYPELKFKKQKA